MKGQQEMDSTPTPIDFYQEELFDLFLQKKIKQVAEDCANVIETMHEL